MAERSRYLNGLAYGHFGTATYDQADQDWVFARHIGNNSQATAQHNSILCFEQVSEKEVVHGDVTQVLSDQSLVTDEGFGLKDIEKAFPELSSTLPMLSEAEHDQSNPDGSMRETSRPTELFAIGYAAALKHVRGHRIVPIAAFASGGRGCVLRLCPIEADTATISTSQGQTTVEIPAINSKSFGTWNGNSLPIRQIVFSNGEGIGQTWLAVRQDSGTTIFHPFLPGNNVKAHGSEINFGHIDANPMLTLPISRTGGHCHSDIAFHPKNYNQIAIVDTHGHWSVWEFLNRKRKSRFEIRLIQHGVLHPWNDGYRPETSSPHHDGWHSIRWIEQSDQSYCLAVCDRRKLAVFSLHGELIASPEIPLGSLKKGHWILDMQSTRAADKLFMLTTTQILTLAASNSPGQQWAPTHVDFGIAPLWRHFRSLSDVNPRILLLEEFGELFIFLYSRSNALVSVFHASLTTVNFPISLSDPVAFQLPGPWGGSDQEKKFEGPIGIHMYQVEHRSIEAAQDPVRMFKLFSVGPDLSCHEMVFLSTRNASEATFSPVAIPLPQLQRLPKSSGTVSDRDLTDFIVDDDYVVDNHTTTLNVEEDFSELQKYRETHKPWPVSWKEVYEAITVDSEPPTLSQTFSLIQESVESTKELVGMKLIGDLVPPGTSSLIEDVGNDAPGYEHILGLLLQSPEIRVTHLWNEEYGADDSDDLETPMESNIGPSSHSSAAQHRDTAVLSKIYNRLLLDFHKTLPSTLPARVRIAKEKVIRQVTADLALSSVSIHRPTKVTNESIQINNEIPSSPPVSTPPSSQPIQSSSTSRPDAPSVLSDAYAHLRSFTTVDLSSSLTIPESSSSLQRILSHLPPPSISPSETLRSPSTYSYSHSRLLESGPPTSSPSRSKAEARMQRRRQKQQDIFESSQRERMAAPMVRSSQAGGPASSAWAREGGSNQLPIRPTFIDRSRQGQRTPGFGGISSSQNMLSPRDRRQQLLSSPTRRDKDAGRAGTSVPASSLSGFPPTSSQLQPISSSQSQDPYGQVNRMRQEIAARKTFLGSGGVGGGGGSQSQRKAGKGKRKAGF